MMSFISIVVLILSLNTAPTLTQNTSITSEELFAHWEAVKESIRQTRNEILVRQDHEVIELIYGAQQIKMKISERFEVYNTIYRRAITKILKESNDEEVVRCVMNLNAELIQFDEEALDLIDNRVIEGELLIYNFIDFLNVLLESISDLRSNVESCNRSYCTNEISTLLSRAHEMVSQDIATFEEDLSDTIKYLSLNDEMYAHKILNLLRKLKFCVYVNV